MILKDDFYTVIQLTEEGNTARAVLELNPEHPVFEGHFPGQPVVPGVCMVQMIKEILETVTAKNLVLQQADHIKFLSVINPKEGKPLSASVQYNDKGEEGIHIVASLHCAERICLKCSCVFAVYT
ncbi:MAG TPA: 3-hydroxyacyl-ACP dehydratase [Agriterribacter sp.]|nr:3-hydroxyacyl-ACP dehydratase [Agriterribacter sp.]HRQ49944.1 3-hydroxyacyl-ACP dehydratase [Agriterribacter sp.]